jgi:hypothetical protein
MYINPLNAKLNPICHLHALLGAHPIFHVSRIRVNDFPRIINKISHTILFADDTNIFVSSSDLNELNETKFSNMLHF